jgi:hypothetical protein
MLGLANLLISLSVFAPLARDPAAHLHEFFTVLERQACPLKGLEEYIFVRCIYWFLMCSNVADIGCGYMFQINATARLPEIISHLHAIIVSPICMGY